MNVVDPHRGQQVLQAGVDLADARGAMILLHGRGASAADILSLVEVINRPEISFLAPEAAGKTWYPRSFLAPIEENEPGRTSALGVIAELIGLLGEHGIAPHRVALLGFSQGACLALEFAARIPRRYGAIVALTGGLIGATLDRGQYGGSLDGTPIFIGTSDVDPFIPLARVEETAEILRELGAEVTERVYPGMAHTINEDEVELARQLLDRMIV